jgi:DNA-binding transcriptional MerR regulator
MGKKYQTKDVLAELGVCRHTLYNWFTKGKIADVVKDRNGSRIYTEADLRRLKAYRDKISLPTTK